MLLMLNFSNIKNTVISFLLLFAAFNFVRTSLSIMENSKRLDDLNAEVLSLESEKTELSRELEYRKTDEYIEQEARNNLNLVKNAEEIFIKPKNNYIEPVDLKESSVAQLIDETTGRKSYVLDWVHVFSGI